MNKLWCVPTKAHSAAVKKNKGHLYGWRNENVAIGIRGSNTSLIIPFCISLTLRILAMSHIFRNFYFSLSWPILCFQIYCHHWYYLKITPVSMLSSFFYPQFYLCLVIFFIFEQGYTDLSILLIFSKDNIGLLESIFSILLISTLKCFFLPSFNLFCCSDYSKFLDECLTLENFSLFS